MEGNQFASISPSFNSYSSPNLAKITARVIAEEFRHQSDSDFDYLEDSIKDDNSNPNPPEEAQVKEEADDGGGGEDDDFEFSFVCKELESSPISADEIFSNGQIRHVFPLFNRDLMFADVRPYDSKPENPPPPPIRLPLGRLLMEDREPSSCSSSEAEELEGVPAETYCVWNPEAAEAAAAIASRRRCKKSSSTGTSSKRWKFRDLLFRSNSEGKDTFVFLTTSLGGSSRRRDAKVAHNNTNTTNSVEKLTFGDLIASKQVKPKGGDEISAVEEEEPDYVKSKESKGEERRRSILPFKQDLVGFFSNMNGLSRDVHPF